MNLRYQAARILCGVMQGRSLADLDNSLLSLNARDRSFVQALVYGTCRFYTRLEVCLNQLLKKPLREKDRDVHALILVGLFQLMQMNVAPYAAVAETVNALEPLKKPWAMGLLNALLREYLRRESSLKLFLEQNQEAMFSHPNWWIDAIKTAWPSHWQAILQANNEHPPFSLRVNQKKIKREQYLEKLNQPAHKIEETESGIILESPMLAENLPGFSAGEVSVQDGAAQLAAPLLTLSEGLSVLDACAAPGGKLMHILERDLKLSRLIAVEKDPKRSSMIERNLSRLQLSKSTEMVCICEDAADTQKWWDGQLVDRILLDVPCSASGVIRRHPDIKLLREHEDLDQFKKEQSRLLSAIWPLLKPGGLLLYVTCSIFPQENTEMISEFLANQKDAKEDKIEANWGIACKVGRQILPGMHQMDGFYYARIQKI